MKLDVCRQTGYTLTHATEDNKEEAGESQPVCHFCLSQQPQTKFAITVKTQKQILMSAVFTTTAIPHF